MPQQDSKSTFQATFGSPSQEMTQAFIEQSIIANRLTTELRAINAYSSDKILQKSLLVILHRWLDEVKPNEYYESHSQALPEADISSTAILLSGITKENIFEVQNFDYFKHQARLKKNQQKKISKSPVKLRTNLEEIELKQKQSMGLMKQETRRDLQKIVRRLSKLKSKKTLGMILSDTDAILADIDINDEQKILELHRQQQFLFDKIDSSKGPPIKRFDAILKPFELDELESETSSLTEDIDESFLEDSLKSSSLQTAQEIQQQTEHTLENIKEVDSIIEQSENSNQFVKIKRKQSNVSFLYRINQSIAPTPLQVTRANQSALDVQPFALPDIKSSVTVGRKQSLVFSMTGQEKHSDIKPDSSNTGLKETKTSKMAQQKNFQPPPKVIDLTFDTGYEHRWRPILPALGRPRENLKDPDEKYKFVYDRREVDRDLFEKFQDQGEYMQKEDPNRIIYDEPFWEEEAKNQKQAQRIVKDLQNSICYDINQIRPQAYQLSIAKDEVKKKQERQAKKEEKRKKVEEAQSGAQDALIRERLQEQKKKDMRALAEGDLNDKPAVQYKSHAKPKNMSQALEQYVAESSNRADPIFSRGAELEITTMQDLEMLKAHLAAIKFHIPAKALERGIIMPRDQESTGQYPSIGDYLMKNPYPKITAVAKKKKGGAADKDKRKKKKDETVDKVLLQYPSKDDKGRIKVSEFGNLPLNKEGKPRTGTFRMMLPADSDFTFKKKQKDKDGEDDDDKKGTGDDKKKKKK